MDKIYDACSMRFRSNELLPLFTIASYALPVLILAVIWFPIINHYYVPNIVITVEMIDTARQEPTDLVLDGIRSFFLRSAEINDNEELVAEAKHILQGKVELSRVPSTQIGLPFDANDLDKKVSGWANWQLYFASFSIPNILVRAYQLTGQDKFLAAAKDIILGFASYERNAWLPKGFLWNDHAVAERISVMAIFWKHYRKHPNYQIEAAKELLQSVARSAQLLAKPTHFKFATNHGVMQNLALLQICLAFPTLPNIDRYKELALERLHDQMLFYINNEGVVLEHSAGYQKAGVEFLGMAIRYLTLLNEPVPQKWRVKYEKSKDLYALLRRPDGSLPMLGDTHAWADKLGPLVTRFDVTGKSQPLQYRRDYIPNKANSLYPVAGYSIWWNGLDEWPDEDKLSQTVVAWSYFPSNVHKHADEMSVLLWAGGHNWWTNVGYWPYGMKGRSQAVSWAGSNAPHLVNEPIHSKRQTNLLGYSWSDDIAVIDLERKGPIGYASRRQVIQVKPNLWIVLDHTFGDEAQRTTTTWTTSHDINLSEGHVPGSYILEEKDSSVKLAAFILASKGVQINRVKGSFSPFAGWEGHIPAPAIVIRQSAKNSWAAAIWLLQELDDESRKFNYPPFMENWISSTNWQIELPFASGSMSIWRKDNRVFVHQETRGEHIRKDLQLPEPPQISDNLVKIYRAYENAAMKYPQKNYSLPRHLKATYLILIVFLLQEIFFFLYKKIGWKYDRRLRILSLVGWLAIGLWVSCRI